jgi:hypothetical protein
MTNPDKNGHQPSAANSPADTAKLVSVDDTIDDVARQALEQARRAEEREKYRHHPGPIVSPQSGDDPPIKPANPPNETQPEIPKVGSRDAPGG